MINISIYLPGYRIIEWMQGNPLDMSEFLYIAENIVSIIDQLHRQHVVGMRDMCDRFVIPEKLYGRKAEVASLLAAFARVTEGNTEMMLVAGFSGIGKTVVVNEVHKPIVQQRGYFIKGKFDQFQRNIPFSALVQALRDLMGQLLRERDAQIAQWKADILTALGENGQAIADVIPELECIIGKQPALPELSGSAAQNRFNLLFQKCIQIFTTPHHPLVIFFRIIHHQANYFRKTWRTARNKCSVGTRFRISHYYSRSS